MKRETIDHELLRPELVRLAFLLHPEDLPDLQGAEQARQYPGALAELGALGLVDGLANAGDALAALGHGPHGAEQAVAAVARVADDARLLALPLALPAPVAAGPPPLPLDRRPRHRDVLLGGRRVEVVALIPAILRLPKSVYVSVCNKLYIYKKSRRLIIWSEGSR